MLLINKPKGPTSHDIIDQVRKATGEKRVGHAGTLDPFAEGLLIVLVGREETKRQAEFMELSKVYESTIVLGEEKDTDDITGKTTKKSGGRKPQVSEIKKVLKGFEGEIKQVPSSYSAVKIKGKKAYEIARKGGDPGLKPKNVVIYEIKVIDYKYPELKIEAKVGSGTYIRALARDVGRKIGTGAYVKELKRTRVGDYHIKDAIEPKDLKER